MRLQHTLSIFFALSLTSQFLLASDETGGQSGAFLRRGVGSRALAMGNAYTSVANDASALYWNPAGLPQIKNAELLGMYSILSFDRQQLFVSFANSFSDAFTLGVGWFKFGVTNIDGRDAFGNPTQKFDDSQNSFMLSLGKAFGDVAVGVTGKYLNHFLFDQSATGFGVDVGTNILFFNTVRVGLVVQDIAGQLRWNTESSLKETLPLTTRAGLSVHPDFVPVVIAAEIVKVGGADPVYRAGGEWSIVEFFGVRAGYDSENVAFGGFARMPGEAFSVQVDYAATRDVLENQFVHHVSLRLDF